MKKIFLIDGSGFLYRSYFGMPTLTNSKGENVNVIFGFFKMMLRILADRPDIFIVCLDSPTQTIRREQYSEYKATRPPTPDDLKSQIRATKDLIKRLNIPHMEIPGYEADDIIATVAKISQEHTNIEVRIFSSDKDLKQLLGNGVTIHDTMKDMISDENSFRKEFGFEPVNIVDYLALIGDSSDNVAGVAGIGPKTASDLIQKYGTIEKIYENIDQITGKVQEKLITGQQSAFHSKNLITLMEVPGITRELISNHTDQIDFGLLSKILVDEMGFKSMQKLIGELRMPVQESLFG